MKQFLKPNIRKIAYFLVLAILLFTILVVSGYLVKWEEFGEEGLPFKFRAAECHAMPLPDNTMSSWCAYDYYTVPLIIDIVIWAAVLIVLYLLSCLIASLRKLQ